MKRRFKTPTNELSNPVITGYEKSLITTALAD